MNKNSPKIHVLLDEIRQEARKVIIGQTAALDYALITILAGRHALIEGVPGVAKTLLVRTLAQLLGCDFQRVQFTHDTTPSDIIGANVFNPKTGSFNLIKGPIFTSFLIADEINRAPAITQAALLQAMQERQVTIDRHTHTLPPAFAVFATQNDIESAGTFPLPEAQKDRFLLKIHMGYPDETEERSLAMRTLTCEAPETLLEQGVVQPVITEDRLLQMRTALEGIAVPEPIQRYTVELVRITRNHSAIKIGAGPRATQALMLSSRVHAALHSRDAVTAEDVQAMTLPCLEHRLILKPEFVAKGLSCVEAVRHVVSSVSPP